MKMIHVTPAAGARVRMPEKASSVMPKSGAWVPDNTHYQALRDCGDVALTEPRPDFPVPTPSPKVPTSRASSKES